MNTCQATRRLVAHTATALAGVMLLAGPANAEVIDLSAFSYPRYALGDWVIEDKDGSTYIGGLTSVPVATDYSGGYQDFIYDDGYGVAGRNTSGPVEFEWWSTLKRADGQRFNLTSIHLSVNEVITANAYQFEGDILGLLPEPVGIYNLTGLPELTNIAEVRFRPVLGGGITYSRLFEFEAQVVPLPSALPLLLSGLAALGLLSRRRKMAA